MQSVEEVFEEDLPKYLRSVEPPTQAKRDVWNYMFDQAIERSLNWFDAIDKLPQLMERAANYITRDWSDFLE